MNEDVQDAIAILKALWGTRPVRAFVSLFVGSFGKLANDAYATGHLDLTIAGIARMSCFAIALAVWTDYHLCTPAPGSNPTSNQR